MHYRHQNTRTGGVLHLFDHPAALNQMFFQQPNERLLTIAWNTGPGQLVNVDGVDYPFPQHSVLPLMVNQSFQFEHPEYLVAWQFNREFYCIVDHDKEVSCVGFLFYGSDGLLFLTLDEAEQRKFDALVQVFADEFSTAPAARPRYLSDYEYPGLPALENSPSQWPIYLIRSRCGT